MLLITCTGNGGQATHKSLSILSSCLHTIIDTETALPLIMVLRDIETVVEVQREKHTVEECRLADTVMVVTRMGQNSVVTETRKGEYSHKRIYFIKFCLVSAVFET